MDHSGKVRGQGRPVAGAQREREREWQKKSIIVINRKDDPIVVFVLKAPLIILSCVIQEGGRVDIHVIFKFSVLSVLMSLFDVTDRSCHKLPLAAKVLRMDEKCQLFSRKMWGNYVIMHP